MLDNHSQSVNDVFYVDKKFGELLVSVTDFCLGRVDTRVSWPFVGRSRGNDNWISLIREILFGWVMHDSVGDSWSISLGIIEGPSVMCHD